jgi:hypothetical protein
VGGVEIGEGFFWRVGVLVWVLMVIEGLGKLGKFNKFDKFNKFNKFNKLDKLHKHQHVPFPS